MQEKVGNGSVLDMMKIEKYSRILAIHYGLQSTIDNIGRGLEGGCNNHRNIVGTRKGPLTPC